MAHPESPVQQVPAVVRWLHDQLVVAHLDLAEYKRIYTEDEEDLDLLNSSGGLFFIRLYKLYWSSFVQLVGRLMDPAVTCGEPNASLLHLLSIAKDLPIHARLVDLEKQARPLWEAKLKVIRNKVVAHNDLSVVLDPDIHDLYAETTSIETLLTLAGECVKLFYEHYENTQVSYGKAMHPPGAALMLKYLRKGKAACDAEQASGR